MKKIAIQDANILIDLLNTGLFGHCLALQYEFVTTDIILAELYDEQVALIQPHINSGKFLLARISERDLTEIQSMCVENPRLSEQDLSAYHYALRKDALLLTGDNRLRIFAESKGLTVCGILWVLDQLVDTHIIAKPDACSFLRALTESNRWLPQTSVSKE